MSTSALRGRHRARNKSGRACVRSLSGKSRVKGRASLRTRAKARSRRRDIERADQVVEPLVFSRAIDELESKSSIKGRRVTRWKDSRILEVYILIRSTREFIKAVVGHKGKVGQGFREQEGGQSD